MNKGFKATFAILALSIFIGSAVAWACTPQYLVYPLPLQAGSPGSQLVLAGQADTARVVEVRWNSAEGPVLGTGVAAAQDDGYRFSVPITIPDASPGVHYLMVVSKNPGAAHEWEIDAQGRWVTRAAFTVVSPGSANQGSESVEAQSADLWQGFKAGAQVDGPAGDVSARTGANNQVVLGMAVFFLGLVGTTSAIGLGLAGRIRSRRGR